MMLTVLDFAGPSAERHKLHPLGDSSHLYNLRYAYPMMMAKHPQPFADKDEDRLDGMSDCGPRGCLAVPRITPREEREDDIDLLCMIRISPRDWSF